MFRIDQILPAARFRKEFYAIVRYLEYYPQPILITRRRGEPFVLLNGEIFDDLLRCKHIVSGNPVPDIKGPKER